MYSNKSGSHFKQLKSFGKVVRGSTTEEEAKCDSPFEAAAFHGALRSYLRGLNSMDASDVPTPLPDFYYLSEYGGKENFQRASVLLVSLFRPIFSKSAPEYVSSMSAGIYTSLVIGSKTAEFLHASGQTGLVSWGATAVAALAAGAASGTAIGFGVRCLRTIGIAIQRNFFRQ